MLFIKALLLLLSSVNCSSFDVFNKYLNQNSYSSTECQVQKELFLESLKNRTEWAVSMLDASGRLPQAITQGNVYDLGMYDQCLNIYEEVGNVTIKGKYCIRGLSVPVTDLIEAEAIDSKTTLLISTCLPDACLPSDFFGEYGIDDDCQTKDENESLDGGDIAFLIFLSAVSLAIAASTAYDYYLQRHFKAPHRPLLLAFSVYKNGRKIARVSQQTEQILFFNGMKVISMLWVVVGHRLEHIALIAVNKAEIAEWKTKWYASYILLFRVSVDTFLFVSAALMSSSFLKSYRKSEKSFNIPLFYIHRYLRLTPALAALYFFQATVIRRVASGPFGVSSVLRANCIENWWPFFLYIQNYVSPDNMCLIHTWYVDADMQFTLIAPLFLIPLLWYPRQMTRIVLPIIVCVTTVYPMIISYLFELKLYSRDFYQMYYYKSHMRLSEWLVGIIFGVFLADYRGNELKYHIKSKMLHLLAWLLVFVVFAVQLLLENKITQDSTVLNTMLYYPLQRTIWCLCLCWISYACLTGNASSINWFLSLPLFQRLSKITYSAYLVHFVLIEISIGSSRTLSYFSYYKLICTAVTDIVFAFVVGTFWVLAFEYPWINIDHVVFNKRKNEEQDKMASLEDPSINNFNTEQS